MGVVGQGVEEQVGQALARQVFGHGHAGCQHQPRRVHTRRLRAGAQVGGGLGVVLQQPQHAAGSALQQAHPHGKHRRADLVVVVEAAEHKTLLGQAGLSPAGRGGRYGALAVVDLVAVRQAHDVLGVEAFTARRRDGGVAHDVVDVGRTHGAREAQVVHLHGGAAPGQDAGAAVLRVTLQVHGNVHLQAAQQLRHLGVALLAHVDEAAKGFLQALAHAVLAVGAERDGDGVEAGAVVALEALGHQVGGGVVVEVGRQVGHTDAVMVVALTRPQRLGVRWVFGRGVGAGVVQQGLRVTAEGHQRKGLGGQRPCPALGHRLLQLRHLVRMTGPVTHIRLGIQRMACCIRKTRVQRQGLGVAAGGLGVAAQRAQGRAAVGPGIGKAGLLRQHGVVGGQCLGM